MSDLDLPPPIRVAIVTALAYEGHSIARYFEKRWHPSELPYLRDDQEFANALTIGMIGHHSIVLARTADKGKAAAVATAGGLYRYFQDLKLVLVVGIMAANVKKKDSIHLGDVIVSTGIVAYDSGTRVNGELVPKVPLRIPLETSFLNRLSGEDEVSDFMELAHRYLDGKLASRRNEFKVPVHYLQSKPKVQFGYVASGDIVVKDEEFMRALCKDDKDPIEGLEMEGAGVDSIFPAKTIIIKSVVDYATESKENSMHQFAAYAAAAYAIAFLDMRTTKPKETSGGETNERRPGRVDSKASYRSVRSTGQTVSPTSPRPSPHNSPVPNEFSLQNSYDDTKEIPSKEVGGGGYLSESKTSSDAKPGACTRRPPTLQTRHYSIAQTQVQEKLELLTKTAIETCMNGNKQEIRQTLVEDPAIANRFSSTGLNLLHMIIGKGAKDGIKKNGPAIAELLCEYNADINAVTNDSDGWTPLHFCAKSMNREVATILLGKGADVNALDSRGYTPLDVLAMAKHPDVKFEVNLIQRHKAKMGRKTTYPKTNNTDQKEARKFAREAGRIP